MSAARALAPLGSTTTFMRSKRNRIVATISSSVTVTTSSTSAAITANVFSPGSGKSWPSAIERSISTRSRRPARNERCVSGLAAGSTPTTPARGRPAPAPRLRAHRLDRGRDAGDEAAAADRDDDHVEVGHLVKQLEARGALARHDEWLVVGMHEREAAVAREVAGHPVAVVGVAIELEHLGAVALGRGALGWRRVLRHE